MKIDNVDTKVDDLSTTVGSLEMKVGDVDTKVDDLHAKMIDLNTAVGSFKNQVTDQVANLNLTVGALMQVRSRRLQYVQCI